MYIIPEKKSCCCLNRMRTAKWVIVTMDQKMPERNMWVMMTGAVEVLKNLYTSDCFKLPDSKKKVKRS